MAFSELSSDELLGRPLTVRAVEPTDVAATDPIRHVDQLESATYQEFYELLEGGQSLHADETGLEAGEVIVFTDYYRVEPI